MAKEIAKQLRGFYYAGKFANAKYRVYIHHLIRVSLSFIRFIHFCLHVMYLNHISKEITFLHFKYLLPMAIVSTIEIGKKCMFLLYLFNL